MKKKENIERMLHANKSDDYENKNVRKIKNNKTK